MGFKFKKFWAKTGWFLICSLIVSLVANAIVLSQTEKPFSDVDTDHENFDAIVFVKAAGIVEGYKDGSYKSGATINRAEFTKILVEAVYEDGEIKGKECFSDVKDEWFAPYVCTAFDKEIVQGYSDGTFKPAQEITFVEAAKIIVIALGEQAESNEVWYVPFVQVLSDKRVIPASVNGLEKKITRGDMAEMIYRIKANVGSKESMEFDRAGDKLRVLGSVDVDASSENDDSEDEADNSDSESSDSENEGFSDGSEKENISVLDSISNVNGREELVAGCDGGKVFVPEHAFVDGCEYRCRIGYKKSEGKCVKVEVPENAYVEDYDFICKQGYRRDGDKCLKVEVPENAFLEGYDFKCRDGYDRQGDQCVPGSCDLNKVEVPEVGAQQYFCDFECLPGYCKNQGVCEKIDVPFAGAAFQCDFTCDTGYCKEDGVCKKIDVPDNAKIVGCDFECYNGYCRKDNQCVRVKIPEFGVQDGCTFECGLGYVKEGDKCVKDESV